MLDRVHWRSSLVPAVLIDGTHPVALRNLTGEIAGASEKAKKKGGRDIPAALFDL